MKTNYSHFRSMAAALIAIIAFATSAAAAPPAVTAQINPGEIALGESAQLTVTVSGDGDGAVALPAVPELEFMAAGESSEFQSINGVTSSSTSYTYQVTPQRAGTIGQRVCNGRDVSSCHARDACTGL